MTRAERIAERILSGAMSEQYIANVIADGFRAGTFNDLLGPEVTAEVMEGTRQRRSLGRPERRTN